MKPIDLVLHRLAEHVPVRSGQAQRCPAHDDRAPSLSVREGRTGVVLHCHAGCSTEAVLDALNLTFPDLRHERPTTTRSPDVTSPPPYDPSELLKWRDQCHQALLHSDDAEQARTYLESRGVTEELVRAYTLGWAVPHTDDRLTALGGRIVVVEPSWGARGRLVPGVRPTSTPRAKWRNTKGGAGAWRIRDVDPHQPVVLVEGVLDVLGLHRMAPGQGIAIGGKVLKTNDAHRLRRRGATTAYLSLDPDASRDDWEKLVRTCVDARLQPVILRGPRRGDWGDTLTVPDDLYYRCATRAFESIVGRAA